ncbi:protein split ends isoform X2 [Sabethes cyaneus]|uniref:protein split ends isoform X2 n=1 Tax=Sabethes cyaneus TaxID=53552 RepID=UPI00237D8008|nr:protein split ends isoform X2 [Sabethes cyaneus]
MVRETRHLWVGNLPETVQEDRIREHFKRSTPVNHHRISSNSWYSSSSSSATSSSASGDNPSISQHPASGAGPLTPARNLYSAVVVQSDTCNTASAASPASAPSSLSTTATTGTVGPALLPTTGSADRIHNNNSYDKLALRKKQKSRSSDSESPSDGGHHHQPQHHHTSHHSRHTSPISSSNHVHHHHHHHHPGQNHNHFGAATSGSHSSQHTHINRSDRSNSRSRSRSPSSSCSSTNSTTTSQSNETSSTTRSPATLILGGGNSSAPFGSGREVRSDRLDREQICSRGSLQSAVTVGSGNNNGGSSSGASSSSGSGGGNLNCHSEDNRPLAICVRNLPARSSDTSLKDGLFHEYKKHGKVTWVKVVGQSTDRYALVCFKKPEDVEKALEVSHDKLFFGCKIEVAPYQGYDVDDNEFRPYEAELDEYHPKSTRTLFIGNLEKDITAGELRKHFDCFGEIIEIDIKKQGVSAYAFCQYSDIVSVVKAMRKMDGEHLGSNRIKLGFGKSMPTNCVWIDGISDSVGEGYLESQFDHFGAVSRVNIDRERKLALVFFEQVQCAQVAVKEMRGATLRGRKLQVDFASRECQDAFFDKLDKQANPSFGSPRFDSGTGGRYSNSRYVEGSSRSRAASFSRPNNPLSLSGAVSPRLDPSPVSSNRGGGAGSNASTRSRIVRYSNDDYYLDGANSTHSNDRRFRSYDEYSQGSAASSHEDPYEHDGYNSSHARSSAHDRLQPPPTSDSPPPIVTTSGLSSSIQSRLGEVEPLVGIARKRNEKSPGDIRYLQKERVHILEQLEECPSSGDELVSPKKRIKYNSDAHHGIDPSDHHHPHYSSEGVNDTACSSACDTPVMGSAGGNGTGVHHLYGSSGGSSNHYNSHHHHHHHNSSENCVQPGFPSSAVAHHRKCVEVRRLSDCNLQQSKSLSNQSTPSSMHSNNNSRRPSTDSTTLHQRHGSSSSNSSSSLQQSHLDSGHPYPHSLSKRRKTILNSDNSMTVIASAGASTASSSNEHHHSSRGRGHQLHSIHSHEASGGESADGSRPGTPLCDERPENLPPSEPRRIPTSRTHNQEPLSLPLPRFAIQFLQQYRLQNQSQLQSSATSSSAAMIAASTHSSTGVLPSSSLQQVSSSSLYPTVSGSSAQSQSALSSLHSASSSAAMSGPSLFASNSSLLNNTLSSSPPTHSSKLSLAIPPSLGSGSNTDSTQASTSCATNTQEHGAQAPASPLRAPSVSSNSSDSEAGPSISPSLEERINRLDEMYEKWSGNSQSRLNNSSSEHHFSERHHNHTLYLHNHIGSGATSGSLNQSPVSNVSSSSTSSFRHKFLELDVHEVPPSDIVKSVLSRKSIFDEDLKRLENISDKYEPGVFINYTKNSVNINATGLTSTTTVSPVNTVLASQSPLHALKAQTPPATSLQRLGSSSTSGSPMNSPQPYNSPKTTVNSCLQYPFPSHPPTMPSVAVTASASVGATHTALSVTSPSTTSAVTTTGSTNSGTIVTSHCSSNTMFTVSSSPSPIFTSATSSSTTSVPMNSWAIASSSHSGTTALTTTLCRSNSATPTSKPKTNVLNKSISLTEKASTNISSNNNNNLTCNSNNLTSTSGSCNTSVNESSATVASTNNTIATTTSITTLKVSSTISSSSSSTLPNEVTTTVASDVLSVAHETDPLVSASASSSTTSTKLHSSSTSISSNPKSATHTTTAPPGSTNSGTIRSNNIPTLSTNTSAEGVQQHSNNSNTNNNGGNSSNSNSEKEDKHSSNGSSGSKHHKDRRKLSTASSCSTSSTGSSTPTTSSNHPPSLESKPCEASPRDESHSQGPHQSTLSVSGHSSAKYNKQTKSNHVHSHSHRHSSDSSSSVSSNAPSGTASKSGNSRNDSDDTNEFDRLKLEVPVNSVTLKGACLNRKEKEEQERDALDKDKDCKLQESHLHREKEDSKRIQEQKSKEVDEQRRKHREENERIEQEDRNKLLEREKEHKSLKERDEKEKADREKRDKERARLIHDSSNETIDSESNVSAHNARDELMNHQQKERRNTFSSGGSTSPIRSSSKRRLSSQDSNDSHVDETTATKKHKQDNHESDHISERKDSAKEGKREKHHKSYSRSEKSCKSFGMSSAPSEKSASQANVLNSASKNDNLDEKHQFVLEERRKEIVFSGEEQMQQSHHHKKKDRYHEKHKSKKDRDAFRDKENTQNVNFSVEHFADHRSTSDEEDHARVHHKKERKSSKDYGKRYHSESGVDYKKYDRKLSRAESSADEEGRRKKNQTNNRMKHINNSSDTDDSDEPKKHSIFDIPDEGPNISMYDKVKARSCKNMQKQEEEKKIKAKFSKLKQSRAKREGKNRSKSWDEDSDTDGMNSDTTINSKYNPKDQHNKSGITTSDDDEHLPTTPRIRRQTKDHLLTDSEEEHSRIRSNRDRLNNLCDDESSEGDQSNKRTPYTPRRSSSEKKASRKNSRSTRIQSDTDSEDNGSLSRRKHSALADRESEYRSTVVDDCKSDSKTDSLVIKQEVKSEEDTNQEELGAKVAIKVETKVQPPSALITSDVSDDDVVKSVVKSELIPSTMIKKELVVEVSPYNSKCLEQLCGSVASDNEPTSAVAANADIDNTVSSAVDHLIYDHSDAKKKHKKKQKRHKTAECSESDVKSEKAHSPHEDNGMTVETSKGNSDEQVYASSKKKHSGKKDKRRDRTKEEYEKSSKSKRSKNKHKEGSKLSELVTSNTKREDKMEDIFGPISDEESQHSSVETESSVKREPIDHQPSTISKEDSKQQERSAGEIELTVKEKAKEESRRRRERKRREREKIRAEMSMKEEDNSVDLDEAGRALEAQLMSDSDQKADDASPTSTIATSGKRSSVDVMDVFRFTDGDDSMETSFSEKKESDHSRREKKKKKKRGKDEKHKHHHTSGGGSNHSNPPTTTPFTPTSSKLSLDIISAQQEDSKHNLSKPSPSLPCLLEDSPPCVNQQSALTTPTATSSEPIPSTTLTGRKMSCSTPTKEMEEASMKTSSDDSLTAKNSDTSFSHQKRKSEIIPGFREIDQQLHEKAVLSISGEFITEKSDKDDLKLSDTDSSQKEKSDDSKVEEKSRAVISQEETEDAVAALLGESFGTSNADFSMDYSIDPAEESSSQLNTDPPQIPEEDDEEMKKAILSLNTEEHIKLDMKPDTPQSEHDLQIDTDTDDGPDEEHSASLPRFDNPPKTPDVDLSQIGKSFSDSASSGSTSDSTKKDEKLEMPDTPGKNVVIENSPPLATSKENPVVSSVIAKVSQTIMETTVLKTSSASVNKPTPIIVQSQRMPTPTTIVSGKEVYNKTVPAVASPAKPLTVFTSSAPSTPSKSIPSVTQKTTSVCVQPVQALTPPQIRHQYIMQAPPTINIPEQHTVYHTMDTVMSPRGPNIGDPRVHSPKLQIQPQPSFIRTTSPTATSPNILRPQSLPNRQSPQLSPVLSPHPMIIHQPSGHILMSSTSSNNQFAHKAGQIPQPAYSGARFPIGAQVKTVSSAQKTNEPLTKQNINTFGMVPGTRIVTTMTNVAASLPIIGSEMTTIAGSGTKVTASSTTMPVTTYVIHNTKALESGQKPGGTPTKTIIHQQPVYIQHAVKQFAPQTPISVVQAPLGANIQSVRQITPPTVTTTTSNVIVARQKEDNKFQNSTTTMTSSSNLPLEMPTDIVTSLESPAKVQTSTEQQKSETDETASAPCETKSVSASSNEEGKALSESMLTEENVAKIPDNSSGSNVLGLDQEDQEGDSKEDSDYWSSKDTIIDSVIKKVDALCSEDDASEGGSELNKEDWNNRDDKSKVADTSSSHASGKDAMDVTKSEETIDDVSKADESTGTQPNPASLSTTTDMTANSSIVSKTTPSSELVTEEHIAEPISSEHVAQETSTRGGKRGGRRGGRKISESMSTPTKSSVIEKSPEAEVNPASRRGGKTGPKRGRGGGRGGSGRGGVVTHIQSTTPPDSKGKAANSSGSDVYEFHDDSGEEVVSGDKQANDTRPRLILTIKNQPPVSTAATTSVLATAPATNAAPIVSTTVSSAIAMNIPVNPQLQPTTSCPATQPPVEAQSIPAPASDSSKEEFAHPLANTRKSRRLLEKDGRTTVDDIIEDVIRNGPSLGATPTALSAVPQQSPQTSNMIGQQFQQQPSMHALSSVGGSLGTIVQSQHQPPPPLPSTGEDFSAQTGRRHTRHNAATVNAPIGDARKSPRAGRKGKDRKISESSVDSNDEKSAILTVRPTQIDVKADEKSVAEALTATTPVTPSVPVTRPNEMASLADKAMTKEKPKPSEEFKSDIGPIGPANSSLTLIDPVTGELTVMRTGKEGQYVPMPNAPQPLKKVIAAAVNAAQNAADQLKSTTSSPTPPISASASPVSNRAPTPGTVPSPGMTRVPTPNTIVAPHPQQQLETHKISTSMLVKQSSPLPLTSQSPSIPATTVVIPSPHTSIAGTVVIQQGLSSGQPQTVVQHSSAKPHTLKAHVLNSQQQMMQQQQHPQPGKPYQQATSQQPQIVYKSVIPQQPGAIHTTTGKQIHPSTNIKLGSQTIQGIHTQTAPPQQIIIQNTISQQQPQMTINKHTLINKQSQQQQQQTHQTAIHHPPGSGNLLINIPQNMHQLGNVPMSPRLPQHHQVVIASSKPGQTGPPVVMQQTQAQHSPQIINKQQPPGQSGQPSGTQQIIIHSAKLPSSHQQIPTGYTTVLQTGGKIIHQGPIQLGPQQQSLGVPGKHATQTIQISGSGSNVGGGIPLHYQNQPGPQQTTIVHKTITTVHGNPQQQVKVQQQSHHKVVTGEAHMQPGGHLGGKPLVQHNVPGKLTSQSQQLAGQNQSMGLGKVNHVISSAPPVSSGNQQPPQPQSSQLLTMQQQQQGSKGIVSPHLHQAPQILTGAVASPPLKQPHMQSQQPIVAGASSARVAIPSISPQGQQQQPGQNTQPPLGSHLRHVQQPGLNVSSQVAYEANPTDAAFRGGMPRDYVKYMYGRSNIHIPSRSPLLPGSVEQRDLAEMEESIAASPPLELRRPSSGPRPLTTAVPHSLQSPGDRSTDSPQVAQVYIGSARIPHTYSDSLNTRFYDPAAGGPNAPPRSLSAEPPPAHRPHNLTAPSGGFPPGSYPGTPSQTPPPPSPANLSQQQVQQQQLQQRDMQQQRDRGQAQGHTPTTPISAGPLPAHTGGITAVLSQQASSAAGRGKPQIATPPIGAPVAAAPTQSDSLEALLQRYPVMWQGLLALKNDQAAVQMHFVHGNPGVAGSSLPSNSDGTTPPLRIAQRMRLEPAQIDGVARKMQVDQEHCMLLALPCGRDRMDVVQQQNNLQTGFITYLQQKQAAGIVNIAAPGSSQAAYVVHIFPSCEFANENLARIAPDLMHRVANIQYLLIVIATV